MAPAAVDAVHVQLFKLPWSVTLIAAIDLSLSVCATVHLIWALRMPAFLRGRSSLVNSPCGHNILTNQRRPLKSTLIIAADRSLSASHGTKHKSTKLIGQ